MSKPREGVKEKSDGQNHPTPAPVSTRVAPGPPRSTIREYFEQGVVTVIMALFLMTFIAQAMGVPTGSMQNTIHIGDYFFVNKFIYGQNTPLIGPLLPAREIRRGEVVVFKFPPDPKVNYVKRVIGLPGDEVEVRGTQVLVNGQELPEQRVTVQLAGLEYSALPELKIEPASPGATYKVYYRERGEAELEFEKQNAKYAVHAPVIVPPNSYFVMGDSRDNSLDSRYWGFVPRANIVGRPLYVHWSFNPRDPQLPSTGFFFLDFFTKTQWRRTGTAIR